MILGAQGLIVRDYATIYSALTTIFTNSFPGVDMTAETKEATFCRDLALWLEGNENVGLDVWVNLNIDTATGVALQFIGLLKDAPIKAGTKASIDVVLTSTSQPYIIPAGQFKLINTDFIFENTAPILVTGLSQTETLVAISAGATNAQAGDKLQSVNYVAELSDIEIATITDGTDIEDDEAYRARLKTINSSSGESDVDAIYAGLVNLIDVTKCQVFENDTNYDDIVTGIPKRSVNAVVLGDTDQNVADVIFAMKAGATPTFGSYSATSIDNQGYGHAVYFDRPTKKNVYISCTATKKETQVSIDGSYDTIIRQGCTGYVNRGRIGDNVSYTTVYGIFAKYNAFDIVGLEMSDDGVNYAASGITIGMREYAYIDDMNADIVLVTV